MANTRAFHRAPKGKAHSRGPAPAEPLDASRVSCPGQGDRGEERRRQERAGCDRIDGRPSAVGGPMRDPQGWTFTFDLNGDGPKQEAWSTTDG